MLTDKHPGENTIANLGYDRFVGLIAAYRGVDSLRLPRDRTLMLNVMCRDYCAITGAFVSEMFESTET